MSEQTKIAWADSTLNFWEGCTKVSAGCANCYAEARDKRFTGGLHWGNGALRRKSKSAVKDALAFNRKPWICDACGQSCETSRCVHRQPKEQGGELCNSTSFHRRRIFSLSLGDWLDSEVPIEWLAEMLDTILQCDQVTWILCTKRPENFQSRLIATLEFGMESEDWLEAWLDGHPPANIILLTSVENQAMADLRIPELLRIPAACRGLSLEPLLGPVDLNRHLLGNACQNDLNNDAVAPQSIEAYQEAAQKKLGWLIIGGESGPVARGCFHEHIRSLVEQGNSAGVAVFVKQLGSNSTIGSIRDKKGGNPVEWPEDLRVQQFPSL